MNGRILLAGLGAGAVVGLVAAAVNGVTRVGDQGYLTLGWLWLAGLTAAEDVPTLLLVAIAVGGALGLLAGGWSSLRPEGGAGWGGTLERGGRPGTVALALAGVLVALIAAGRLAQRTRAKPEGPSVLLVVIDSLRADHVGSYGHPRDTTPSLDELAAGATRYAAAYSTAPWTTPSVASMFTGRHPTELGIADRAAALDPGLHTLAERLRQNGYRTGAVVSHCLLSADLGFDQGFEVYDEGAVGAVDATTSPEATDRALRFLRRHADEPFFLFVHYFDPHYDYVAHPETGLVPSYDGPLRSGQRIFDQRALAPTLGDRDRAYLTGLYDSEIRHNDEQLGRLLAGLDEAGRLDDTLVIVTADHGEAFLERGDPWIGHSRTLFDELIRVPLVVHWPGQIRGEVEDTPVSLVSLHGSVAVELGLTPSPMLPPPVPVWQEAADHDPILFAETRKGGTRAALIRWPWKLIAHGETESETLFRLDSDPGELRDLASEHPDVRSTLAPQLHSWSQRVAAGGIDPSSVLPRLSRDQEERLRALGYL